jgi:hypothetical protein
MMGCTKTIYIADVIVPYTATHLITRGDRFISLIQQDLTRAATTQPLKPTSGLTYLKVREGEAPARSAVT